MVMQRLAIQERRIADRRLGLRALRADRRRDQDCGRSSMIDEGSQAKGDQEKGMVAILEMIRT
jgi:hypothetical protein